MPLHGSATATAVIASTVVCGLLAYRHYYSRSFARSGYEGRIAAHELGEVTDKVKQFLAVAASVRATLSVRISCEEVADDAVPGPGQKIVHFIRHGEGAHNVAQRKCANTPAIGPRAASPSCMGPAARSGLPSHTPPLRVFARWRQSPSYDGLSEPYTLDMDPSGRYTDAELTPLGVQQAVACRQRTAGLRPQLLVVSPLRRATQTGLISFERHIARDGLRVLANELCHETAGRHTCDRRLSRTDLAAAFPRVDYSEVLAQRATAPTPYLATTTTATLNLHMRPTITRPKTKRTYPKRTPRTQLRIHPYSVPTPGCGGGPVLGRRAHTREQPEPRSARGRLRQLAGGAARGPNRRRGALGIPLCLHGGGARD